MYTEQKMQNTKGENMNSESKCPVMSGSHARGTTANQHWWPNQLNLKMLHQPPPPGRSYG